MAAGLRFPNSYSQSNESLLSHAALFTGRYPSEVGWPDYLEFVVPDEAYTLAEALADIGYEPAAFSAQGHVRGVFGFDQGFSLWSEEEDFAAFFHTVPRALAWLEQRPAQAPPAFLFLHGYDCHRPYGHDSVFHHPFDAEYQGPMEQLVKGRNATERIVDGVFYKDFARQSIAHASGVWMSDPTDYLRLARDAHAELEGVPLSPRDLDHMVAHYDGAVLSADTYVGRFLQGLREQGRWENTLVIVLADHGEDLQTHGFSNHRAVVYDSTTRVPLDIGGGALPDAWRGVVRDELVDAVDLVPTVMDMAGTLPPAGVRGRSLWAVARGEEPAPKAAVFQQACWARSRCASPPTGWCSRGSP